MDCSALCVVERDAGLCRKNARLIFTGLDRSFWDQIHVCVSGTALLGVFCRFCIRGGIELLCLALKTKTGIFIFLINIEEVEVAGGSRRRLLCMEYLGAGVKKDSIIT